MGGGESIAKVSETFQGTIGQKCVSVLLKLPGACGSPGDLVTDNSNLVRSKLGVKFFISNKLLVDENVVGPRTISEEQGCTC